MGRYYEGAEPPISITKIIQSTTSGRDEGEFL